MRRSRPAQHGTVTARFHRGHIARLGARCAVPDAVDASKLRDQITALVAALDLAGGHASGQQLRSRDDPMTAAGNRVTYLFDRAALTTHAVV
jgi:hypothetical protein